jgi:hypothetical protein
MNINALKNFERKAENLLNEVQSLANKNWNNK